MPHYLMVCFISKRSNGINTTPSAAFQASPLCHPRVLVLLLRTFRMKMNDRVPLIASGKCYRIRHRHSADTIEWLNEIYPHTSHNARNGNGVHSDYKRLFHIVTYSAHCRSSQWSGPIFFAKNRMHALLSTVWFRVDEYVHVRTSILFPSGTLPMPSARIDPLYCPIRVSFNGVALRKATAFMSKVQMLWNCECRISGHNIHSAYIALVDADGSIGADDACVTYDVRSVSSSPNAPKM